MIKSGFVAGLFSTICITGGAIAAEQPQEDGELSVKIFGLGHVSIDSRDDTIDDGTEIASNSSRVGFTASWQVSDSLEIFGQVDQGVDLTGDGTNDGNGPGDTDSIFSRARDSFIGLRGNYGTIKYGRLGALNQWVYDYNLFVDQVGDLGNIWGGSGFAGRADNSVSYETPEFNGFRALALHSPQAVDSPGDVSVFKLSYGKDNVALGVSFSTADTDIPGQEDYQISAVTGSYTFENTSLGDFDTSGSSIGAGFQSEKDIRGVSGEDRDSFTLGAALKLNARHTLKGQSTFSMAERADSDATQYALGYDYQASNDVILYAAYAKTDNDRLAGFTSNNYGHGKAVAPVTPGASAETFSVGIIVSFDKVVK